VTPTTTGLLVGAVLALSSLAFGFGGFLLVLIFMAVGFGVGRVLEGKLDVRGLADALRGRRSS
jgi:uncharacterized membrane protein